MAQVVTADSRVVGAAFAEADDVMPKLAPWPDLASSTSMLGVVEVAGGDRTVNTSALTDRIDADELLRPVKMLGGRIREQVAELKPSKITIETGIAVAVRNGKLTALLVDGQADVSFTLTLEWDLSEGEAD